MKLTNVYDELNAPYSSLRLYPEEYKDQSKITKYTAKPILNFIRYCYAQNRKQIMDARNNFEMKIKNNTYCLMIFTAFIQFIELYINKVGR